MAYWYTGPVTDVLQRRLSLALIAGLVLWGGYSLLAYLGVEIHAIVLVNEQTVSQLRQLCPGGGLLCRGAWTVLPTLSHIAVRLQPLWWFIVWCAVLAGGALLFRSLRSVRFAVEGELRPWHVLLLFVATVWLAFEVLSITAGTPGNPMRILYEPLPQVYVDATQEELDVLMQNKNELEQRGCLSELDPTPHGAKVYRYREWCVQAAFFTRVLPPLVAVLAFAAEALLLGSFLLRKLRLEFPRIADHAFMALLLGFGMWMVLLWTLAQFSLYTMLAGWVLLAAVPALCVRDMRFWWRVLTRAHVEVHEPWYGSRVVLLWLLFALLAVNFLTVVRPFPIGWDDLGRYLNQPRLLVSYGTAIPTMGTFQWEFLTSLGYLLFGYDSTFGATVALLTNWLGGPLAVAAIFLVTRAVLGSRTGLLAALLYYVTPVVGHFSFADMKTENTIFAFGTAALLCVLFGLFSGLRQDPDAEDGPPQRRLFLLAGIFAGLAFSMKATGVMTAMAAGVVMVSVLLSPMLLAGGAAMIVALYVFQGTLNVTKVSQYAFGEPDVLSRGWVLALFLGAGLVTLLVAIVRQPGRVRSTAVAVGLFSAGFLVCVAPWSAVNSWKAGYTIPILRFAPPNTLSASFALSTEKVSSDERQTIRRLPADLAVDRNDPACEATSGKEELDRYWGDTVGVAHYLTLPWRSVLDLDSGGYYVTELPGMLLLPLLFLLPAFWSRRGRGLRALGWVTVLLLGQWVLLANGVPWYGIGMFLGLVVAVEALVRCSPTRGSRIVAGVLAGASLIVGFSMRFWQMEQQKSLLEYPIGKVSARVLQKRTINHYDLVRDTIVERAQRYPQAPYTYRVGTFIPYFVPKNLEHLPVADNQLDMFNCINQERDHALTLRRLQALGFNSLVFDTNTATIERNPDGTLHQKVNALLDFLNDGTLGLTPVVSDLEAGIAYVLFPVAP